MWKFQDWLLNVASWFAYTIKTKRGKSRKAGVARPPFFVRSSSGSGISFPLEAWVSYLVKTYPFARYIYEQLRPFVELLGVRELFYMFLSVLVPSCMLGVLMLLLWLVN